MKSICDAKVSGHYGVDPAERRAAERLKAALTDVRYIFPGDILVSVIGVLNAYLLYTV